MAQSPEAIAQLLCLLPQPVFWVDLQRGSVFAANERAVAWTGGGRNEAGIELSDFGSEQLSQNCSLGRPDRQASREASLIVYR